MEEDRKTLVKKVMDGEEADRIPVGFWWHYLTIQEQFSAVSDQSLIDRVIKGHKKTFDEFHPDFVKVMSDGFFADPSLCQGDLVGVDDLKRIKPIADDDPWIDKQVQMVKEITEYYEGKVMTFYNVFSPLNVIRIYMEQHGNHGKDFVKMVINHPVEVNEAAMQLARNQKLLLEKLKSEVDIDGIYYSVQNIQSTKADWGFHCQYVMPSDKYLLDIINNKWKYNILHICGDGHFASDITFYKDYEASAYNWAVTTDKVSLKEGRDLFGKTVIGGFDNSSSGVLYSGTREAIKETVETIVRETGRKGLIIGADCTIPSDIDIDRLKYIRSVCRKE